jgi:hypothetical protein
MASSKWQKRNKEMLNRGLMISVVTGGLLGVLVTSMGYGRWGSLVALLVAAVGYVLTFILTSRHANVMIRVLVSDYQELESDFRNIFADNHIRFVLKIEEDCYHYKFSGTSLTMTVEPHAPNPFGNETLDQMMEVRPAAQITLGEIDSRNHAFANQLAALIDELAAQQA